MTISKGDAAIIVLGAGVSGLSTAIALLLAGFSTTIVAADSAGKPNGAGQSFDPRVASNYAMASAYPHNLLVKNLARVSDDSQDIFKYLHDYCKGSSNNVSQGCIELHRLFEVFESKPEAAPLADRRMNFVEFAGKPIELQSLDVPHRPGAEYLWGFFFDTYFADMPRYMNFLWTLFEELGGQFVEKTLISQTQIEKEYANRTIVNCLGLGAIKVFADHSACNIVRGQQVLVPSMPRPVDSEGKYLAYNYTPNPEIFARADGSAEYVHFFSRADGWILGQTREPGSLTDDGQWQGAGVAGPRVKLGDQEVAEAFLSLNETLLSKWQGLHLPENSKLLARYGLRYYRDPSSSGVRLEVEKSANINLVHNYGHGGSGITMSWGCALEVIRMVRSLTAAKPAVAGASGDLALGLQKVVLNAVT